jgi:NTE family protein
MSGSGSQRADLVFEGGGVKGIGLAGAWCHLAEQGYTAERVAGTSAGAITAALVAAGMSAADLRELVLEQIEYPRLADGAGGVLGEAFELGRHKGLHPGRYFEDWIRDNLAALGVVRFGDLRAPDVPADEVSERSHRLQVIASDVSCRKLLVLPRDALHLGVEPDELDVAHAIRMSMSIPVFFDPVVVGAGDHRHLVVDGGLLSNFPVWLFDVPPGQEARWPTFGFLLVAPDQRHPLAPASDGLGDGDMSLPAYLRSIAETALEARDRMYLEQAQFARTITIDTVGVGTTQFDIEAALKRRLFDSGVAAATEFLAAWDFEGYKRAFRAADPGTRRDRVAGVMAAAR